jgi:hypothetical protein
VAVFVSSKCCDLLNCVTPMPCNRPELESRERQILAPYAQFSADSRGRVHVEDMWKNLLSIERSISGIGIG